MPARTVRVQVEVPEEVSAEHRAVAEHRAQEAVVLSLWEAAELSTREAAEQLGLGYAEFLDLLAARGLPVARGTFDEEAVRAAAKKIGAGRS